MCEPLQNASTWKEEEIFLQIAKNFLPELMHFSFWEYAKRKKKTCHFRGARARQLHSNRGKQKDQQR